MKMTALYFLTALLSPLVAHAGEADVLQVKIKPMNGQLYQFEVTVSHADEGWEHYADQWDVVAPDGSVMARRMLSHPHDNEQPFTRILAGVKVPEGVKEVTLRAHDSVHDYGGKTVTVALPR